MSKLEIAKSVVLQFKDDAPCGIYCTRNCMGDIMTEIHRSAGLKIDFCKKFEYLEVFGLTDDEFEELRNYYDRIQGVSK